MPIARLPYVRHRGVTRHPGSVLTLAVTEDGTILASGGKRASVTTEWTLDHLRTGSQGTRLWNVADMSVLERPSSAGIRGATLVVIWARQADETQDVLYAGTQNGYFFCWRQRDGVFEETFVLQMPDPGEITAMAFDLTNNCLCLCSRNDMVQSWAISKDPLTGKWMTTNIFSRKYPRLAPQAITFAAFDNSQDRDIMVLGLHNSGPIYTIRGKTGEPASEWSAGAKIGDAVFNWKDGVFCIDDPTSGPALFRNRRHTRSTASGRTHVRERFVSGSMGQPLSAVATMGEALATLSVGTSEWVQTEATAEIGGVSVVFAAQTRALDFSEEIFVWKRAQETSTGWGKMGALVVLGCIAFVYQNLMTQIRVLQSINM
ncbi:hypothetical protein DFH07DRAFT_770239 [Mycena maculata]|uniref:WD40 repeat-like protein n=1 Tax=Mycena maculata TaxID=230809 RepID=A0AAD7JI79_9AGAR|nr:hypothetical protein DFH07DRAFT_770239 [Mycena maculata]